MLKRLARRRNSDNLQATGSRLQGACQTCSGCRRPLCNLCVYCRGLVLTTSHQRKCLFRLCLHFSYTEKTKRRLAFAAQRSFQSLSMGERASDDTSTSNHHYNSPQAKHFLRQCQNILLRTHKIPVECRKWQFDSSWRVWVHKRQQWGIAQRVSSDPPRYDIRLLDPSPRPSNCSISINSNYSIPHPPQRANATSSSTKNASMLTNVPAYVSNSLLQ
jgi:hypothetical protein